MRAIRPKIRSHPREHIVTIDTDSAPRIMFYGENLLIEDLPVGTRVIYPKRPMTPVANPKAAIRYAQERIKPYVPRSVRVRIRGLVLPLTRFAYRGEGVECPICGGMTGCKTQAEGHFAACGTEPSEWPLTIGGWLHRVLRTGAHGVVQEGVSSRAATARAVGTIS